MMNKIERVAAAMQSRRAELINQPLSRIWDDLARVALEAGQVGEWIDWDWSSDMPVPENTLVDVQWRDERIHVNQVAWFHDLTDDAAIFSAAARLYWVDQGSCADIVRYRVVS